MDQSIKRDAHGCDADTGARRLNVGRFAWPRELDTAKPIAPTQAQFDALVV
jgi:hypothetical protein